MPSPTPDTVRTDFVQVTLVDPRGRVLMQERDEHAPVWPDRWCFPGGGLEDDEHARRRRRPRAGRGDRACVVAPGRARPTSAASSWSPTDRGTFRFHAFVGAYDAQRRDVECHEGRQMVFVDPDRAAATSTSCRSTALVAPATCCEWIAAHPFDAGPTSGASPASSWWTAAAGCCSRSATSTRASTRRSGASPAVTSTPARTSSPPPTASSRRRRACGCAPGDARTCVGEFVVDHRDAYGTWDRMQVFVAADRPHRRRHRLPRGTPDRLRRARPSPAGST